MISKATQLVVQLADRPGVLARLCSVLGDAKVNIIAVFAPEAKDSGSVRVMVVDLPGARAALKGAKMKFSEEEVLDVELDNRPGAFAEVAGKLAKAKINIRYAYATTAPFARARVIIAVPDVARALVVLSK
ncbi:MAG: ACT domain-containing protein [Nitrososphaerota archaeon]|nr:ACT domain-containing protein [Nitrososphaerota archaeon]